MSLLIDYSWWKELGQTHTFIDLYTLSTLPIAAGTILCWIALLVAHARGVRFAGGRASDYPIYSRLAAMQYSMNVFQKYPVFGVGVGLRKIVPEPHNVVITTMGESGVVGVAVLLVMFGAGFRTLFRAKHFVGHDPAARLEKTLPLESKMVHSPDFASQPAMSAFPSPLKSPDRTYRQLLSGGQPPQIRISKLLPVDSATVH